MSKDSGNSNGCSSWFKWLVGVIIAVLAAGTGIVALLNYFTPDSQSSEMRAEITLRLEEISDFLSQEPMTNRDLYNATQRIDARGVGASEEFRDTTLRTLLFELEQAALGENQPSIQDLRDLFDELTSLAPEAPFRDGDRADPEKVRAARASSNRLSASGSVFLNNSSDFGIAQLEKN